MPASKPANSQSGGAAPAPGPGPGPSCTPTELFLTTQSGPDGAFIAVSDSYCARLGATRSALLGCRHEMLRAEAAGGRTLEFWTALQGGCPFRAEFCVAHADGTPVWFECVDTPVFGADGTLQGFTSFRTDITARREAEESSRRTARFLEQTGRVARIGGWEFKPGPGNGDARWTDETLRIFGLPAGTAPTPLGARAHFPAEAQMRLDAAVAAACTGGASFDLELPFMNAAGADLWVRVVGHADRSDPAALRLYGTIQDITEHVARQFEIEQLNQRMALAAESGAIGVFEFDVAANVLIWDRLMCRLFGLPEQDRLLATYELWTRHLHPEDRNAAEMACADAVAGLAPLDTEFRIITSQGELRHVRAAGRLLPGGNGQGTRLVGVNWDVTEQRRLAEEMMRRATHDDLTGLVNRAEFESRLERLLFAARETHSEHALIYLDLDQFKLVNDACGHAAGDRLLRQVSGVLRSRVRPRDTVARLGGDEFAIILERCSRRHAEGVAQALCETIGAVPFHDAGRRFQTSASLGLVPVNGSWPDAASLMQAADTSCYAAKEQGRNRVHTWCETDSTIRTRHGETYWATRVEQALDGESAEGHGFALYAQRIEPLGTPARGVRAEVLLRMTEPDGKVIAPGAYMPAAERFHLSPRIDRWVLRNSIAWLESLPNLGLVDALCVNVSGQSIGDSAFHRFVLATLAEAGPEVTRRLCLEVTETAAITNLADAAAFMTEMRGLGVRIALDDFGAGTSSFGYLKSLPVDYLKIDGQFVRDMTTDALNDVAVRCFVDVARVIGVKTVAEFVQTPEILARLRKLGVDYGQGFLLHRPVPLQALLTETRPAPEAARALPPFATRRGARTTNGTQECH